MGLFNFGKKDKNIQENKTSTFFNLYDADNDKLLECKSQSIRIGREPQKCNFVLDAPGVSRLHASIECINNEYYIEDLGSNNGTYLNGEILQVRKKVKLSIGDELILGRKKLYFEKNIGKTNSNVDEVYRMEKAKRNLEKTLLYVFDNKGEFDAFSLTQIVNGFCGVPLYISVKYKDETKNDFEVMMLKLNDTEVIPLFSRKEEAEKSSKELDIIALDTEHLLTLMISFETHIVLNPFSEARVLVNKDIIQKIIIPEYIKKSNAKKAFEGCVQRNDFLAATICKYIMECDNDLKDENFKIILSYLSENSVWVPGTTTQSPEDLEKFLNAKKGDTISLENDLKFKPDLLKNEAGKLFFPVFSTKEEAPEDYRNNFSWMNIPFIQCCQLVKGLSDTNEIIINALSNHLILDESILDIIVNHAK